MSLASDLKLNGDAAEALAHKYGAKPNADFIKDAWPTLLVVWLPNDTESLGKLQNALRARGLGNVDIKNPLLYLKSCRNTANLREDCIRLFIAKGERRDVNSVSSYDDNENDANTLDARASHSPISRPSDSECSSQRNSDELSIKSFELEQQSDQSHELEEGNHRNEKQLSDGQLALAIALLTPEIKDRLLDSGFIDKEKRWINKDKSAETFKRAIEVATVQDLAEVRPPSSNPRETKRIFEAVHPESASAGLPRLKAKFTQDRQWPVQIWLRVLWFRHRTALIGLAFLSAFSIVSGSIGFLSFLLLGLSIVLVSYYTGRGAQLKTALASVKEQKASSLARSAVNEAECSDIINPLISGLEPPRFNYTSRIGKQLNTDEWGKANMQVILQYSVDVAIYCLEIRAMQHRSGRGSSSTSIDRIWDVILELAPKEDKELAGSIKKMDQIIKKCIVDILIDDNTIRLLPDGELELIGEATDVQEVGLGCSSEHEVEIDGITFPLLTNLSPDEIHFYASSQSKWIESHPGGAENWAKIVAHSRLLSQGRISAFQTNGGPWLYSTVKREDISLNDQASEDKPRKLGSPLTGSMLVQRVNELGDMPAHSLALACGYVTKVNGSNVGDVESYYRALFDAHRKHS